MEKLFSLIDFSLLNLFGSFLQSFLGIYLTLGALFVITVLITTSETFEAFVKNRQS